MFFHVKYSYRPVATSNSPSPEFIWVRTRILFEIGNKIARTYKQNHSFIDKSTTLPIAPWILCIQQQQQRI